MSLSDISVIALRAIGLAVVVLLAFASPQSRAQSQPLTAETIRPIVTSFNLLAGRLA